jgi:hypothetical protein
VITQKMKSIFNPTPCFVLQVLALICALLICAPVCAQRASMKTFGVDSSSSFAPVRRALRSLVADQSDPNMRQTFCVIGYFGDLNAQQRPTKLAWVYWRQKKRLILWAPAAQVFDPQVTLLRSHRSLDLVTDVVPTDADVGGSTYLVSKPWVDALITDCAVRGTTYTLQPPQRVRSRSMKR